MSSRKYRVYTDENNEEIAIEFLVCKNLLKTDLLIVEENKEKWEKMLFIGGFQFKFYDSEKIMFFYWLDLDLHNIKEFERFLEVYTSVHNGCKLSYDEVELGLIYGKKI